MRAFEFVTEDMSRRGFLKALGAGAAMAAAPGISKAGEYIGLDDLQKDPDTLVNVWEPRLQNLQSRCNQMLAKLIRASGSWAKKLQDVTIEVHSNEQYIQADTDNRSISIDLTVFWDAPDDILAFAIGHELGHIALAHTTPYNQQTPAKSRQQELDADDFGVMLAKSLGYNKASIFRFMHAKKGEYELYNLMTKQPHSTHPTYQQRMNRAQQKGYQLSRGGIQQMNTLLTHLA